MLCYASNNFKLAKLFDRILRKFLELRSTSRRLVVIVVFRQPELVLLFILILIVVHLNRGTGAVFPVVEPSRPRWSSFTFTDGKVNHLACRYQDTGE
jgi:hypothetical protein